MKKVVDGQTVIAACDEQEWLDRWEDAILAHQKHSGSVEEAAARRYGKLRRAYEGARQGGELDTSVTAMVGYVNAKTGLMVTPHGREEVIAKWGKNETRRA